MSPEAFEKRLRASMYSSMSVRRDPHWAVSHGFHPDAWQVWDVSHKGEPYVVFVCQRGGVPMEPNEDMLAVIRSMDFERLHGGRKSWAKDVANYSEEKDRQAALARERSFRERFDFDFVPRARHFTNHGRVHGLNGRMVPQ